MVEFPNCNEYIQDKSRDGIVTWIEFLDYYKDISVGIDRDDYFELMMRNAWHISGSRFHDVAHHSPRRPVPAVVHEREQQ